jgi:hypothetical protein|tara:strand:- start:1543 stop:1980 length:438 start_codon:yes stop_codon:yes gene_type:complete
VHKIYDKSKKNIYKNHKELVDRFLRYSHKRLGYDKPVEIHLVSDEVNGEDPLGLTGQYNFDKMIITIFVDNRHFKDILRSLAHELVHHDQACRGDLSSDDDVVAGYAQRDKKMRQLEREAYLQGNLTLRDFEDTNYKDKIKIRID